jgi:hypothetical protein
MHDSVWPAVAVVGVLAGWFALQKWILPAFGVST